MKQQFLIISGSEKCGTTSLFQYLADSGLFSVSKEKETDYFRGDGYLSLEEYLDNFSSAGTFNNFLEASPGYLSDSHLSAKKITQILTDYHLVFCLRNPLERLVSSFTFHQSRLYIPKNMSFEEYFDECIKYEKKLLYDTRLSEWCLRVPNCGKYFLHLQDFLEHIPEDKISVYSFDDFKKQPMSVVKNLLLKLNLDSSFYDNYDFKKSNVTFKHKNDFLQRIALKVNKVMEKFWIKNPSIKSSLLQIYKKINSTQSEKLTLSSSLRSRILEYYRQDMEGLSSSGLISDEIIAGWVDKIEQG